MKLNYLPTTTSSRVVFFSHFVLSSAFLGNTLFSNKVWAAEEQDWGIAAMFRTASIPYDSSGGDHSVSTFVPMLFFKNDYVFIDGTEMGAYLYQADDEQWSLNAIARMRFIDIPASAQNAIEGDTADFGVQFAYQLDPQWSVESEFMSDGEYNFHGNLRATAHYQSGDWEFSPSATLRYKSADFNSRYFSLSDETLGAGVDLNVGVEARYHVLSNLYLLGSTSITRLDDNAYQSSLVEDRYQGELYFGFGFFNNKEKAPKSKLSNAPYLRVAHGWATPSNIGEIFTFNKENDPYNNQLTSFFYGHPLTDELFGFPLDIYLTPGIVHHWRSDVQSASTEYIVAFKAYYTFNWPTQWRFGVAEGLSYIDSITYIEGSEMERKGYKASHLLNYLDFSFDVNVGDLIGKKDLNNLWFGYSLHHRSAIFEQASQFGRIKGGSNYNTVYFQYEF
ncbi:MipA/OmpV family protein [uncultured Vibrio sp.]|uniref:MipA/OmpV family protein n=1 Tax=uncultured Vibrio sp. TaxID=114054 RepID=UPI002607532D|nr:MipA/OmpV family protein [uncultured Vibrio sp.]